MLNLRNFRIEKGLKQNELAKIIGVENYTIGNWERNRAEPSIVDLIKLSNFFECSIDALVGNDETFNSNFLSKGDIIKEIVQELMSLDNENKFIVLGFIKGLKNK